MPSENMKVSLYSTVLNEESSIRQFLDSLLAQSRKPDEIIIVDGGSTDKTVEIVNEYINEGAPIRLIVAKGTNIAQGRNIAIKNAKHEIIASTDAGCRTDKNWLENLISKFDENTDIISGVYLPDPHSLFEECFAELYFPDITKLNAETFLPSHRSIAFRKKVWEELNFPESCYRSEDTWFDREAKNKGFKFKLAKDAIVYWRPRKNLREVFRHTYRENKSNIENNVNTKETIMHCRNSLLNILGLPILIILFIFVWYFVSWSIALIIAILLSPFILKNIFRLYRSDKSITKSVYKNLIHFTTMVAQSFALISGKMPLKVTKHAKRRKR